MATQPKTRYNYADLEDDYRVAHIFGRADTLHPADLPGFSIPVDELLGPEEEEES